jgi:hypothetical protein
MTIIGRSKKEGGPYAPPQNVSASRHPVPTDAGAGPSGACGRGLGPGEQLVKIATQHPHAAADAQRRQRSLVDPAQCSGSCQEPQSSVN